MKKIFSNQYFLLFGRIVIAIVFIYAGAEKISDPKSFSQAIYNYRLLPIESINFFAIILPWIELLSGILLLFGISVRENASVIGLLLFVFIIAVAISMIRGLDIECGCFGRGNPVGWRKIGENTLMLIVSLALIAFDSKKFSLINQNKD
ncbi:DoxX family protein [Ignavibacterium album JCM 16511]|uniref:DoxX family protein n=1 Tax=Ignavibacterium album (strain DSM 19864 / JCM 16511 / NBRC 101810 / Mat9-16) TaxID=945713 RepID=I0AKH4_IGNAJ|nr:MauE/DoxX family redox-associated membrane protein [Ignavibacterium album]AFH49481.1 DoxX family protein [Ignavibacterium album JCM 16511]